MNTTLKVIVTILRALLEEATDKETKEALDKVNSGFCRHCGAHDSRCQCCNDE